MYVLYSTSCKMFSQCIDNQLSWCHYSLWYFISRIHACNMHVTLVHVYDMHVTLIHACDMYVTTTITCMTCMLPLL